VPYRHLFVSATDGLKLHAREYGPRVSTTLAVVCLPGMARHAADFHDLAVALAEEDRRPRRVLALDYRGRGRSEWDGDWRRYDLKVEMNDVLHVLAAAGVHEAVLVGTSRGGLLTMMLSAARPSLIRGAVLNDAGPVVEAKGLVRIRSYLGKMPTPRDYRDGAEILRRLSDAQFPSFGDAEWEAAARGTWTEDGTGRLALAYDPALARTLEGLDPEAPLPSIWPLFEGLTRVPVLVLRGEHSDILSAETLSAMAKAHPDIEQVVVPGQGHAPMLAGRDLLQRIRRFVVRAEETPRPAPAVARRASP
jgi:pimeloyl-ACP methyl ester carboxylesterase